MTVQKLLRCRKNVLDGLHEEKCVWSNQAFPGGHGATAGDTHEGYAYTDKSLEELEQQELVPFAECH